MKAAIISVVAIQLFLAFPRFAGASGDNGAVGGGGGERAVSTSPAENLTPNQAKSSPPSKATLQDQVALLEKKHGITIVLDQGISPLQKAVPLPGGVSLEQSISMLFSNHDYYQFYGADSENAPNRLKTVWVFTRASGAEMRLVPKESLQCADKSQITGSSAVPATEDNDASPEQKVRELNEALSSTDENTWNEALQSAIRSGVAVTAQQMEDTLRNATSDHVRAELLATLNLLPNLDAAEVRRLSDLVLQDPGPLAQDMAHALQKSFTLQDASENPAPSQAPTDIPPDLPPP